MTDRERVIDKVRKLQAHADSAAEIGNEHEAQAFAAKVRDLLTAHKLSQAEIGAAGAPDEPIDITYFGWGDLGLPIRKARVAWTEQLAGMVARCYYCEFVICSHPRAAIGGFVGRETDREVAVYMFVTLGRFLEKLSWAEYNRFFYARYKKEGRDVTECRGFRKGFIIGFLQRLRERFDEEVRPKAGQEARTEAIVLVRKDALAKAREWMGRNMRLTRFRAVSMGDGSHGAGRDAGRRSADGLDLGGRAVKGAAGRNQLT